VIDWTDPAHPAVSTSPPLGIPGVHSLAVSGNVAYVAFQERLGGTGLRLVDISDPAAPSNLGIWRNGIHVHINGVTIVGSTAYVGGIDGLDVVDVSDPTAPRELAHLRVPASVGRPIVRGRLAYLTASTSAKVDLLVVDVSDPRAPAISGSVEIGLPGPMALRGNLMFVAMVGDVVNVVDVTAPTAPKVLGWIPLDGARELVATDVVSFDGEIVVASREGGVWPGAGSLATVPARGFEWPQPSASYRFPAPYLDLEFVGDLAYTALYGIEVWDASTPAAPMLLGAQGGYGYTYCALDVDDGRALTAGASPEGYGDASWLQAFDVSDPAAPVDGIAMCSEPVVGLEARGTWAFAGGVSGLRAIDFSDIQALASWPPAASRLPVGGFDLAGDFAYAWGGGLEIFDVADPTAPRLVDTIRLSAGSGLKAIGEFLYVANPSGLEVLDISRPDHPRVVTQAYAPLHRRPDRVELLGDGIGLFYGGRIHVMPPQCPDRAPLEPGARPVGASPNPFRGSTSFSFSLTQASRVCLEIVDVRGRRVRTVMDPDVRLGRTRRCVGRQLLVRSSGPERRVLLSPRCRRRATHGPHRPQ
jgi:hypothetical protein